MKLVVLLMLSMLLNPAFAKLRFGSYNIRNFDYDQRSRVPTNKSVLKETLKEMNADFIAVQEINKTSIFKDFIRREFNGKYGVALTTCGGAHDQRLGFVWDRSKFELISFEEDLRVTNPFTSRQGLCYQGSRPLAIGWFHSKTTGKTFIAISVHLKSGSQDRSVRKRFKQIEIINQVVSEYKQKGEDNFIIMGDFNTTEYIYRGNNTNRFKALTRTMQLTDVSSDLQCTSYWWGGMQDGKEHPSQLDHILVTPGLGKLSKESTRSYSHCAKLRCKVTDELTMGISYNDVSDHCPIVTEIQ